jgi:hypothetical protein
MTTESCPFCELTICLCAGVIEEMGAPVDAELEGDYDTRL